MKNFHKPVVDWFFDDFLFGIAIAEVIVIILWFYKLMLDVYFGWLER